MLSLGANARAVAGVGLGAFGGASGGVIAGETAGEGAVWSISKRGNPILQQGVYRYFSKDKHPQTGVRRTWRCSKWCHGCRAAVIVVGKEIVRYKGEHRHN